MQISLECGQLEESNIALLDRSLVQHFPWDMDEAHINAGKACCLPRQFIYFKGKIPTQDINGLDRRSLFSSAHHPFEVSRNLLDVARGNWRVHGPNVHKAPLLESVQPHVPFDRVSFVQLQNELTVRCRARLSTLPEFSRLPQLPLVLPQVLDNKWGDLRH